jgi:ATP-dependent DNA helicase RecG
MYEKKIINLIQNGESEILEFKESKGEWKEIIKTISAFANTRGGAVLVGISNKGEISGVRIGKRTIEDLTNKIKENTDPKIFPGISVEKIDGESVILIKVEESVSKPLFAFDRTYKRVGKSTVRATSEEIRKMALKGKKVYWDGLICEEATLKDIDEDKVRWFIKEARKQRGLNISEDTLAEEVLVRLKLIKNGKITNASGLLFTKEPKFLQTEVKSMRISGKEPDKPNIDFQTIEGTVFDLIDKAEEFVLRNIRKSIWLVPGKVQREEKYEYPPDAVREAIVNAIAHRDYESPSKVQVRVFDDYIEIWNPGRLPEGWTVERLKQKHESIPKNPLLFKQLFWVKYVEDVGGGTIDMIQGCREWGIPEPDFADTGTAIVVTFRKSILTPSILEELGLNRRQIKAMNFIKKYNRITTREYCSLFNVARDTANRDLNELLKKGIIKRKGSGPQTYYIRSNISIGHYRTLSDTKRR